MRQWERATMAEPVRKTVSPIRDEIAEAPRTAPVAPVAPVEERGKDRSKAADKGRKGSRRKRLRWVLFALLPIALIAGAYWYVTGGAVMSTDDAYVNAQKVGISTDISGIVQDVAVRDNEHGFAGQALYRLGPRHSAIPSPTR